MAVNLLPQKFLFRAFKVLHFFTIIHYLCSLMRSRAVSSWKVSTPDGADILLKSEEWPRTSVSDRTITFILGPVSLYKECHKIMSHSMLKFTFQTHSGISKVTFFKLTWKVIQNEKVNWYFWAWIIFTERIHILFPLEMNNKHTCIFLTAFL